jgi:hypothetical protein
MSETKPTKKGASMPFPDFTNDEKNLISAVKSSKNSINHTMWAYITSGLIMFAFAIYYDSIPLMSCAFLFVGGCRLYEEWHQRKWLPIWHSIIDKYEAALNKSWDTPG